MVAGYEYNMLRLTIVTDYLTWLPKLSTDQPHLHSCVGFSFMGDGLREPPDNHGTAEKGQTTHDVPCEGGATS